MTFTPQVLTQTDNNNTTSGFFLNFPGNPTITTGFNTLILTIQSNVDSSAGGIKIQFSDDGITNWITPYIDTYFSPNIYTKNYLIIKKYYKVIYDSSSNLYQTTITSRLSTDLDSSITQNTSITVFDNNVENTLDAFGKLRVSNPTTLLDIRFPGQSDGSANFLKNNLQICSESNIHYSGVYSNSKLVISNTTGNPGYYISQSRNYCTYQPGKSLLFMGSGVLYPGNNNYTTRIGYFDNVIASFATGLTVKNGLYFQHSGGNYSVHVDSNGGSIFNITQNNWNIDKMNGSGPSGLTLDFTKTQLFLIDMEWLGVGRIRFGFYAYGRIQYCHQITNINILTQPYTFSINLPICYTIHNTTSSPPVNKFTQICSTVISEGGYTPLGRPFTASTQTTSVSLSSSETPILFLRGGSSNYYHQNIIPKGLSIIADSASNSSALYYRLRLYLAPNSPATIIWTDVNSSYSVCQYATNATQTGFTQANSIIIDENYFFGKGENLISGLENVFSTQVLQLTSNISNTADILVLTCYKTGGTSSVYATLSWQEIY